MNTTTKALCILALAAGGCANRASNPDFAAIDANKDGVIVAPEMHDFYYRTTFTQFDGNGDWIISRDEWNARETSEDGQSIFRKLDVDMNGELTWTEFSSGEERRATSANLLRTMDRDGDGQLRASELN